MSDKEEKTQEKDVPPAIFGISGDLLKATIDVLSVELPMAKARNIVEALEKCPMLKVNTPEEDG